MDKKGDGIIVDTLFVGPTRPTMYFGVTWQAFIINMLVVVETFIVTKNLLWLLMFIPVHAILFGICLYDPRAFELLFNWAQSKAFTFVGNFFYWRAASYSPLEFQAGQKLNKRKLKSLRKGGLV